MRFLVINGPNLNMLGKREPEVYGNESYDDLCSLIKTHVSSLVNSTVDILQSNYEGQIISWIQEAVGKYDGIILNAGAFTHYSYGIYDAILAVNVPTCEVHITDIYSRKEEWRHVSVIKDACVFSVSGHGFQGYLEAIDYLVKSC